MRRFLRCIRPAGQLVLAIGLALHVSFAQTGSGDASSGNTGGEGHSVSGTVVNSVTGEPVSRALVQLYVSSSETTSQSGSQPADALHKSINSQLSMLTDHEGRFHFDGLPGVTAIALSAAKPGFTSDGALGIERPPGSTGDPSSRPLVFKLLPEAILTGYVTDAGGEPLEGLKLRISFLQYSDGYRKLQPLLQEDGEQRIWKTNAEGEYRIAGLMPGKYLVTVIPDPAPLQQLSAKESSKVGYPVTYFPGEKDLEAAEPVQVTAGHSTEADLVLRPVPIVTVSGRVNGIAGGQDIDLEFVNPSGDDIALEKRLDAKTGEFQASIVAAGAYVIKADATDASGNSLEARLNVSKPDAQTNLKLNLAGLPSIPVVVHTEYVAQGNPDTSASSVIRIPASVNLHPLDPGGKELSASMEGNPSHPSLVLSNIEAGRYKVEVLPDNAENQSLYVKSITYKGVDLSHGELTIVPEDISSKLEIVLADDGATLHGVVQTAENGEKAMVVIVPEDTSFESRTIAVDGGEFQIDGLAPGNYKILAFDHIEEGESSNLQALDRYASKAATLNLLPNAKNDVKVERIHREE